MPPSGIYNYTWIKKNNSFKKLFIYNIMYEEYDSEGNEGSYYEFIYPEYPDLESIIILLAI